MGLFDDKSCGCDHFEHDPKFDHKHKKHHCKGCACEQLRALDPGRLVFVMLLGSDVRLGPLTFACFDDHNCCATFIDNSGVTPTGSVIIINCQEIAAITLAPLG